MELCISNGITVILFFVYVPFLNSRESVLYFPLVSSPEQFNRFVVVRIGD